MDHSNDLLVPQYDILMIWLTWVLLSAIIVQGQTITITNENAAIDTGTTLVAGPTQAIDLFYKHIPGAAPVQPGVIPGVIQGLWTIRMQPSSH